MFACLYTPFVSLKMQGKMRKCRSWTLPTRMLSTVPCFPITQTFSQPRQKPPLCGVCDVCIRLAPPENGLYLDPVTCMLPRFAIYLYAAPLLIRHFLIHSIQPLCVH